MASYLQDEKNRKWSVRFRIIENGKEAHKRLSGFKTKKEAIAGYNKFMASYVAPIKEQGEPFDITFDELFNSYIKHKSTMTKESTIYGIVRNYNKHIKPYFGNKKLNKISKNDCINFFNYLNSAGYAYATKAKLRERVGSILKYGVKYYDLPYNIIDKLDNFRNTEPKKEMEIWSLEEFKAFIKVVDIPIYKCLYTCLYFTGARKGEALALTWDDIDFKNNVISINKSLTRKCEGATFQITTPKNASSVRKIVIPQFLSDEFEELKKISNSKLIFAYDNVPLADNTVTRYFKRYSKLAGLKIIRIHDLRHSHASFLISQGESIVLVAKRLGHSDIEQTLNTYSHLMPNEESKMADKLNKLWEQF